MFSCVLVRVVHAETGSTSIFHYFDDFLFMGPVGSDHCNFLLDSFVFLMSRFGVTLSVENTEGPTTIW